MKQLVSIGDDMIPNYTVVVNFKQSSYEVMEDRGEVTIEMELSKSSSKPFEVMITVMDVTANSKW